MATIKEITVQELKDWQESGKDFQLIDVREQHEYDEAQMGGTLIPLGTVMDNVDQFSKDKPVVVHCRSGKRSANAIHALQQSHGFENLHNLEGGILAWIDAYGG